MRDSAKEFVNKALGTVGARAVSATWGPRGFAEAFRRLRKMGITPAQVVDVGASDGQWTRECLGIFPEAQYLLIDPLPENVSPLEAMSREYPNVKTWSGGAGAREGTIEIYLHGDQSSFLPSEYAGAERRSVPVRTLDSFLGTAFLPAAPTLIKADVQGYELEVLRGATRCLEKTEYVLLEVSYRRLYRGCPLAHEVIAFMGERGFRIYDICTYAQRPRDGELIQSDMLFAKDDAKVFEFEGYA